MMLALTIGNGAFGIPGVAALSMVALIGYLFGRSQRLAPAKRAPVEPPSNAEILRAIHIATQLESIADDLRADLARHRSQVDRFKTHLSGAGDADEDLWRRLREEADAMVGPTLELVSQLSGAYDKIRVHSQSLANFSGGRTDPVTGLANSRALEENLQVLLKSRRADSGEFSIALVSLDGPAPEQSGHDRRVILTGKQLAEGLRGDDFAARFGGDEFVVVLPGTPLSGASIFAARLRDTLLKQHGVSVCCGLAESLPADTPKSLLARADSAAYSARAAGPGQLYVHTGASIRPDLRTDTREPKLPVAAPAAEPEKPGEKAGKKPSPPVALAGPPVAGDLTASAGD